MRVILLFSFLFTFFISCAQQESEKDPAPQSTEKSNSEEPDQTVVEDRDPMIDMILVEKFHPTQHWAEYSGYIQGRDAKYYHIDGGYGSDISVVLEGGHPSIQLMIMDINDKMVLRENLNGSPIEWSDTYELSGRYTFIVSLDSRFEGKEQVRTPYDIRFELKPQ